MVLLMIQFTRSFAQDNMLCFITSLKGNIKTSNNAVIKVGDMIPLSELKKLSFSGINDTIKFFSKNGNGTAYANTVSSNDTKESFVAFAKDILKINAQSIALSSRGNGCECPLLDQCIATNHSINDKLLIVDTLFLPANSDLNLYDSCCYLLVWKTSHGTFINKLKMLNGFVFLTKDDLVFNGRYYNENGNETLTLAIYKNFQGNKFINFISNIKPNPVPRSILQGYYETLLKVMRGHTQEEIYQTYYRNIYASLGKPDECSLKKLINYKD